MSLTYTKARRPLKCFGDLEWAENIFSSPTVRGMYGAVCVSGMLMATIQSMCAYRTVYTIIFMPIVIFNLTSLPAEFGIRMPAPNTHRFALMKGMSTNGACKLYTGSPCYVKPVYQTPEFLPIDSSTFCTKSVSRIRTHEIMI